MNIKRSIKDKIRKHMPMHIFFWILSYYILLRIFVRGNEIEEIDYLYTLLFQITIAPFAYFDLWLKPEISKASKWTLYLIASLTIVALGATFNLFFFNTLIDYVLTDYYFISYYSWIDIAQFYLGHLLILTLWQFALEWAELNKERQRISKIEKEKIEFEMKALLTQINPHFLFNTLNSLYSMVINNKSQPGVYILKLADVLRYVIYQSNKSEIPLKEEIQLLQDYISLNELRMDNPNIDFQVDVEQEWEIAPMLLLPLIENAIKHGSINKSRIEIYIKAEASHFIFTVDNNVEVNSRSEEIDMKGIGNENIERRLQIIYPDMHKFEIKKDDHTFRATIELWRA